MTDKTNQTQTVHVLFYLQGVAYYIPCVQLATEPGISLIILTSMKTQMVATSSTCYNVVTFLTQ
jgi:hypothetical protein